MLAILRGDFGNAGDRGGASPYANLCEPVDSFVMVRGCDEDTESMLLVRLGTVGDGASTVTFLGSTGSGDDARGTPIPK